MNPGERIQTGKDDYGKAVKFDNSDRAGTLSLLGIVVFIPLFVAAMEDSAKQLQSALAFIQWTSPSTFVESVWDWIRDGAGRNRSCVPIAYLVFGFPFLIWQWFAFALGWGTLIRPSRLWAVSSVYFVGALIVVIGVYGGAEIPLVERIFMIMAWSIIPGTFLRMTLSLWARTPIKP